MKIYSLCHVSLLERAAEDLLERLFILQPLPIKVKREDEYDVEEVLNCQIFQTCLQYLVKRTEYEQLDWLDTRDINKLEPLNQTYALYLDQFGLLSEEM